MWMWIRKVSACRSKGVVRSVAVLRSPSSCPSHPVSRCTHTCTCLDGGGGQHVGLRLHVLLQVPVHELEDQVQPPLALHAVQQPELRGRRMSKRGYPLKEKGAVCKAAGAYDVSVPLCVSNPTREAHTDNKETFDRLTRRCWGAAAPAAAKSPGAPCWGCPRPPSPAGCAAMRCVHAFKGGRYIVRNNIHTRGPTRQGQQESSGWARATCVSPHSNPPVYIWPHITSISSISAITLTHLERHDAVRQLVAGLVHHPVGALPQVPAPVLLDLLVPALDRPGPKTKGGGGFGPVSLEVN